MRNGTAMSRKTVRRVLVGAALALLAAPAVVAGAAALGGQPLDPAHNAPLACELVNAPGAVPRSARNIVHVANVCGVVGTDIEFQSRTDAAGKVHDYAFLGTMGGGTRIFDITDPANPKPAGGYVDPGWQNDVHVRGDLLVLGFDWLVAGATLSECLQQKNAQRGSATEAGVDLVRLKFDPQTATFQTSLLGCYLSGIDTGGAHTTTIHPSGDWLTINTSFAGIEVVDIRTPAAPTLVRRTPTSVVDAAHDVSFSRDGNTLYSAGVESTRIVDVTNIFGRAPTLVSTVPNAASAAQGADGNVIEISHQSDVSADGKILAVTDEAGGGLLETGCHTPDGKIGGMHFWALAELTGVAKSAGATPSNPKKIGTWVYPNPLLASDAIGRTERGCTIHVFRLGGNGSAGPGPIQAGFDGVSRLPGRQVATAHYGAGVWWLDFSAAATPADGIAEDTRTTWGNTLGWNVMPGADTWSAKEYKGFIYAGDMGRGFDVYGFTRCEGVGCVAAPANTPGRASGGGQLENELAELTILRGTSAGGRASFGFNAEYAAGLPTGHLTFIDHGAGKKLKSTSIETFTVVGTSATFSGKAIVNGVGNVPFTVKVDDLGEPGTADTLTITFQDYVASGVLLKGNIQVERN